MGIVSPKEFAGAAGMEDLLRLLENLGVDPGWAKREPSLWPAPRKNFVPAHWPYASGKAALEAAGRFVSTEHAERRNLILFNPVPGNRYGTAKTIVAAYQMVLPGETARSHRHTANALRLVMDTGPRAYTIVDGRKIPMVPGDVLLTPNWRWHGHANESDQSAIWIDFLDVPMMHFFDGSMFFDQHGDGIEQTDIVDEASPMRFPYASSMKKLDAAAEDRPGEKSIELGPAKLDTLGLHVHRLEAGRRQSAPRTTASNVFAVIDGRGRSNIDGTSFEWQRGDVFVVPAWRTHEYEAHERSHLFRVTDEPLLAHLHWLRVEGKDVPVKTLRGE
jgi:gentisate 1,2-dioxygenase